MCVLIVTMPLRKKENGQLGLHLGLCDPLGGQRPIAVRLARHEDGFGAARGGGAGTTGVVVPMQEISQLKNAPRRRRMELAF